MTKKPVVISVIASKGGTTKTTLVANLGAYLADNGKKVLMIDLDHQASLSVYYRTDNAKFGVDKMLRNKTFDQCISHTDIENLDLIYNDDSDDGKLNDFISNDEEGNYLLRWLFTDDAVNSDYDYIIIDTHGGLNRLFDAACYAGDIILSPVTPDTMSGRECIQTTANRYNKHKIVLERLNLFVAPLLAVISKKNNTSIQQEHHDYLIKRSSENTNFNLLETVIPDYTVYQIATARGEPVHRQKGEPGQKAREKLTELWAEMNHYIEALDDE